MNKVVWNLTYPGAETFSGLVLWGGGTSGPVAIPGTYKIEMSVGGIEKNSEDAKPDSSKAKNAKSKGKKKTDNASAASENAKFNMEFELLKDPRSSASQDDLEAQFEFLVSVRDKLSETHKAIKKIRSAKSQIAVFNKRIAGKKKFKKLATQGNKLIKEMTRIEEQLYQTKNAQCSRWSRCRRRQRSHSTVNRRSR